MLLINRLKCRTLLSGIVRAFESLVNLRQIVMRFSIVGIEADGQFHFLRGLLRVAAPLVDFTQIVMRAGVLRLGQFYGFLQITFGLPQIVGRRRAENVNRAHQRVQVGHVRRGGQRFLQQLFGAFEVAALHFVIRQLLQRQSMVRLKRQHFAPRAHRVGAQRQFGAKSGELFLQVRRFSGERQYGRIMGLSLRYHLALAVWAATESHASRISVRLPMTRR